MVVGSMLEPGVRGAVSNRELGSESIAYISTTFGSKLDSYAPPQAWSYPRERRVCGKSGA